MDKQRWEKIREIFEYLSEETSSVRRDVLDMVCDNDIELRTELEAMLRAHDNLASGSPGASATQPSLVGSHIGKYLVVDVLGKGGMSVVYRAVHKLYGEVAIKVMSGTLIRNPRFEQRFNREAEILNSFNHPVLTKLIEVFSHDESLVIAMELIEGNSLDHLTDNQSLPLPRAIAVCLDVADFLSLAHSRGLVHRDLKPSNLMVLKSGGVKLIDFGIAHLNESRLTLTGELLGSPTYMAPEQWSGNLISHKTDIWALGAVLHRLCCGSPPFPGTTLSQIADQVMNMEIAPWPARCIDGYDLSTTEQLARKMMMKDPKHRLDTAKDAKLSLKKILTTQISGR